MLKDNKSKMFSRSGFSFITKLHDENFATVSMNGLLQIFSGKKPFDCIKKVKIAKTVELYNLKEINFGNNSLENKKNINNLNNTIYLILYEKNILIYSFENNYQKSILIQKINNNYYIGALFQLSNMSIIFWDKRNTINLLIYNNKKFNKDIIQPKLKNNSIIKTFVLSFMEYSQNNIFTTSTTNHPLGENCIRIYNLEHSNDKIYKLINIKNFQGYSCSIFENNICKFEKKKIICIALNYYIKNNVISNKSAIIFINYEFLEITTILEINFSINTIFNFSTSSEIGNYKRIYDYIIVNQFKSEENSKTKKKGPDNNRFLDFYVFDPKYEYEPLLLEGKKILTNNSIDITNSFILNKKNLVIFQTDQINIYTLSIN